MTHPDEKEALISILGGWQRTFNTSLHTSFEGDDDLLSASIVAESAEQDLLEHPSVIAIDTAGKVHGIAVFSILSNPFTESKPRQLEVHELVLAPQHLPPHETKHKGIGRALMVELYSIAQRTSHVKKVFLFAADTAEGFYEKLGMRKSTPPFLVYETAVTSGKNPFLKDEELSDRDSK